MKPKIHLLEKKFVIGREPRVEEFRIRKTMVLSLLMEYCYCKRNTQEGNSGT